VAEEVTHPSFDLLRRTGICSPTRAGPITLPLTIGPGRSTPGFHTVIRRPVRLFAVCLALLGQLVGAFGLPAARGSAGAPDAACGCCPADRTAGRCCCHHDAEPAGDGVAPCCRAKKAHPVGLSWFVPTLKSKCHDPADTVPESVVLASIPPEPPIGWTVWPTDPGRLVTFEFTFPSRSAPPDVPPPRIS
jgi:hypothetical protein